MSDSKTPTIEYCKDCGHPAHYHDGGGSCRYVNLSGRYPVYCICPHFLPTPPPRRKFTFSFLDIPCASCSHNGSEHYVAADDHKGHCRVCDCAGYVRPYGIPKSKPTTWLTVTNSTIACNYCGQKEGFSFGDSTIVEFSERHYGCIKKE